MTNRLTQLQSAPLCCFTECRTIQGAGPIPSFPRFFLQRRPCEYTVTVLPPPDRAGFIIAPLTTEALRREPAPADAEFNRAGRCTLATEVAICHISIAHADSNNQNTCVEPHSTPAHLNLHFSCEHQGHCLLVIRGLVDKQRVRWAIIEVPAVLSAVECDLPIKG